MGYFGFDFIAIVIDREMVGLPGRSTKNLAHLVESSMLDAQHGATMKSQIQKKKKIDTFSGSPSSPSIFQKIKSQSKLTELIPRFQNE